MDKITKEIIVDGFTYKIVKTYVKNILFKTESFYNDKLHSINDSPAIFYTTGKKIWAFHGFIHRENNLPAVIDGDNFFYFTLNFNIPQKKQSRIVEIKKIENGVTIYSNSIGHSYTTLNNLLHSINDQPALCIKKTLSWYDKGEISRELNKPAIIFEGEKEEFWLDGEYYSEEELIKWKIKNKLSHF